MSANAYAFVDRFTVPCDEETAYRYISRVKEYQRWWGTVYKKTAKLNNVPNDQPCGRYALTVGGFLPYTLTLENEVTLVAKPHRIEFVASGDLEGMGIWNFRKVAGGTEVTFDWRIVANKAVIRRLSFLLKPLFRANHIYCVRKAKEGMTRDLQTKGLLLTAL